MSTKRRSRRRLTMEARQKNGRPRMSYEMEEFLAGDNAAISGNTGLLRDLVAEAFMTQRLHIPAAVTFTDGELARLDELETHYQQWRLAEDHKRYLQSATDCRVLNRYKILIKRAEYRGEPGLAFAQAIGPGPNSIVRDVPTDDERRKA